MPDLSPLYPYDDSDSIGIYVDEAIQEVDKEVDDTPAPLAQTAVTNAPPSAKSTHKRAISETTPREERDKQEKSRLSRSRSGRSIRKPARLIEYEFYLFYTEVQLTSLYR